VTGSGHVLLTVTDDGPGMSSEKLGGLFRSVSSRNRAGRGFGFQIVRELVMESGGHLDVESYPGRGTKVSVKWFTRCTDAA
jgi:signal transduction histidine kinase